jgi:myosin heavy subunit
LNNSLKAELDRIRGESSKNEREMREQLDGARRNEKDLERDLRSQVEEARREGQNIERDLRAQLEDLVRNKSVTRDRSNSGSAPGEWRERYEALEREVAEQRQTTEEVRREAAQSLLEMRDLSMQSTEAVEKEERLLDTVSALEREVREWKSRYAKVKSQNRSMRSSSLGLPGVNMDSAQYATDSAFVAPDGLVKDFHLTNYQLAIDELLQLARRPNSEALIEGMKQVVVYVRQISSDVDTVSTPLSSMDGSQSDVSTDAARLRTRLSQAANNLITASKAHAAAAGLAPVSLVDAAASHLTSAVIELVRVVKIRPTPADEIDRDDFEDGIPKPAPLNMRGKTPTMPNESTFLNGKVNGIAGHARNKSSMNSNMSSGQYSAYSRYSRYSSNMSPNRDNMANGDMGGKGLGISQMTPMVSVRESGIEEFKVCLRTRTHSTSVH